MNILVTGGKGYIAENLIKKYNGNRFTWDKKISKQIINFDICDYNTELPPAHELKSEDIKKYDCIVHLAALSGIIACEENPDKAVQDNIIAAGNVFKIATKNNIPTIFTSSQAVKNPTSSVYAFMKWSCEKLAEIYNKEGGRNYVFRLSNVYGGRKYIEKKNTCVKQFIVQNRNGENLNIHGDGNQKRDFIHVYDICNAIMRLIMILPIETDPIDIGTGIGTSIIELAKMFPRKDIDHYVFNNERSAGTSSSIADIIKAKERINFTSSFKLEEYIKEMCK